MEGEEHGVAKKASLRDGMGVCDVGHRRLAVQLPHEQVASPAPTGLPVSLLSLSPSTPQPSTR